MLTCWLRHCWKYYEAIPNYAARCDPIFRKCVRCGQRQKNVNTPTWPEWKRMDWQDEETVQGRQEARQLNRFLNGE